MRAPRVAFLVDDADLEALLIAGFSGVETLARAELPGLAAEHLLAGGRLDLRGANVALIIEQTGEEHEVVRIVDCASGALVVALEPPKMPVSETARWIVTRARPFITRTADPTRPRISLPGLRFVTDSIENRASERELNLMLTARLQARGAVVLERWRMGDLVFEKSIHGQESPYWSAAHLVDGSVTVTGEKWHARVRTRDATGMESFTETDGDTADSLVDAIVERVMTERNGAPAIKNETEGEAFLAESRWMLEHGLPREAWQAAESALALNVARRKQAEALRVKAAAMCAYPDDLKRPHTTDGGYARDAFPPTELAVRIEAATEAMWLAGDHWTTYPTLKSPEWSTTDHPATIAVYSLYNGLRILRATHDMPDARVSDTAIRGLRDAIRRNVELLRNGSLGRLRPVFYSYLANYAGYWNETPEEAVAFYRTILAPDFDSDNSTWLEVIRGELGFGDKPHPPFLGGDASPEVLHFGAGSWRVPGRDAACARATWESFLDELSRSPDVLNRADSLALRWRSTANENARFALTVEIVDFVSNNLDALCGPQERAIFDPLIEPLRDVNRSRDLAPAQEKLVGMFLSLIRSESAVPGHLIACAWVPFTDGDINIREEQGRELLDALTDRRARPSTSSDEFPGIDSAHSSLLRRFPSLHPEDNAADVLSVRSFWMAGEHVPAEVDQQIGFSDSAAVWRDGHLWVADSIHGRLWKVDTKTGDASVVSAKNRPDTRFGLQLAAWGGRFAITAGRAVWVLDDTRTRWDTLALPEGLYQIASAHGALWAVSGEDARTGHAKEVEGNALYRISPDLTFELVASSRRRPAEHPLDLSLAGVPFHLSPARGGGVVIGAWGNDWNFIESASGAPPKRPNEHFIGNLQITSTPGLIIRTKHRGGDRHGLVRAEFLDAAENELLLSHPEFGQVERARFPYPKELESLPASKYAVTWSEDGLDIFAWASRGERTEAWIVRIDATGCAVHPLRFEWPADGDARARAALLTPNRFRHPIVNPQGLIATDHGLVIMGQSMNGFWFIPKGDIEARRKKMREETNH